MARPCRVHRATRTTLGLQGCVESALPEFASRCAWRPHVVQRSKGTCVGSDVVVWTLRSRPAGVGYSWCTVSSHLKVVSCLGLTVPARWNVQGTLRGVRVRLINEFDGGAVVGKFVGIVSAHQTPEASAPGRHICGVWHPSVLGIEGLGGRRSYRVPAAVCIRPSLRPQDAAGVVRGVDEAVLRLRIPCRQSASVEHFVLQLVLESQTTPGQQGD
mmetsp:Transcript_22862/g.55690  ORF Transcript_22862/g.55690 Transcript_22862/m.55690 type:complete len:215 (-) Transcript_22862:93-737(-)